MRIISGKFGGRRFYPPAKNWPTRPTTDIAKEGLFNILQNRLDFEKISMLDLFGGTGSHSFEFASRGCMDITYVDKFRPAVRFVKEMATELEIQDDITIVHSDYKKYIERCDRSFDYIFAGPPYPLKDIPKIPDLIFNHELLNPDGLFVLEHNKDHQFDNHEYFISNRNYGGTYFSFFKHDDG